MDAIRKAEKRDISRIAEILVFVKRMNYRRIFHDDAYSFGELQVLNVAQEYADDPALIDSTWVYDDGFVKGLISISEYEVTKLYVDHFFEDEGIGGRLIEFAVKHFDVKYLWVLEKNCRARAFYEKHGFRLSGEWEYEQGTTEHLQKMVR